MDSDFDQSSDLLRVSTAGPPCVDASSMNGQHAGDSGRSYICTQQFLEGQGLANDDVTYVEITPRWSVALLKSAVYICFNGVDAFVA